MGSTKFWFWWCVGCMILHFLLGSWGWVIFDAFLVSFWVIQLRKEYELDEHHTDHEA